MEVAASFKSVDHGTALGDVRQHPQLELGVVSDDELLPFRRYEPVADRVPVLVERRLVLQVRLARRYLPRVHAEAERALYAAVVVCEHLHRQDDAVERRFYAAGDVERLEHHTRHDALLLAFKVVVDTAVLWWVRA